MPMTKRYSTMLFTDVFSSSDAFVEEYKASDLYVEDLIEDENLVLLFSLLYAKFGNNPIANMDLNQWKYKLYATIFQYGPAWQKRLELQSKLMGLTDAEILEGSKAIYNKALNPGTMPSTSELTEITYINEQNTTNYKKSKIEGIATVWDMIRTDVTAAFLMKFQSLFLTFVSPQCPTLYYDIEEEDE